MIIHSHIIPNEPDTNNYCKPYEKILSNRHSYRLHLQYIHEVLTAPNFYCLVWKPTRKSLYDYRRYCRNIHRITLDPIIRLFAFPDAVIDVENSTFFCAKCDKRLSTKRSFKMHLKKFTKVSSVHVSLYCLYFSCIEVYNNCITTVYDKDGFHLG